VALIDRRNIVSLLVPLGMPMEAAATGPDAGGGIEALDRMPLPIVCNVLPLLSEPFFVR
jgi:hypothetical protein